MEETGFLGRFLISNFVIFARYASCQRLEPCSSGTATAKQPVAFADFSDDQNSFQLGFV